MSSGYSKPIVVAEIGCNHQGDLAKAFELVKLAKGCGASYAKFQKRNTKELLSQQQYESPHPYPHNAFGNTYGEHREFLEFNIEQHATLKAYCEEIGIGYSTSVWDLSSAEAVVALQPDYIKIPSACNTNEELLKFVRDHYKGEIHVALGMTLPTEIDTLLAIFQQDPAANKRLVLYACTSGYPVPFKDVCLLEISKLKALFKDKVKEIGFSGHHLGIAIDVAAYTLGSRWIERHFTKDRTWKGTDHAASLEPEGLRRVVRDLNATFEALTYKPDFLLPIEEEQRKKLKYKQH